MPACFELGEFDADRFLRAWANTLAQPDAPAHWHVRAWAHRPPALADFESSTPEPSELSVLRQTLKHAAWGLLPGVHRLRLRAPAQAQTHSHVQTHLSLCIGQAAAPFAHLPVTTWTAAVPERSARVVVIGAGLAGAACARALAERSYAVQVLDQGQTPAAAASGLPVGLVAPHASPDDSVISRLSRAGVRAMRDAMERLLVRDQDWGDSGVQERRLPGKTRKGGAPAHWPTESQAWTRALSEPHSPVNALWHERGAWVRPAALVHALLQHPRITWQASTQVTHLQQSTAVGSPAWQVMHQQQVVAQADHVVLATGPATTKLLEASGLRQQATPIRPLRGQLSWGLMRTLGASHTAQPNALPASPVNGHGCFVHSIATDAGAAWFAGSTFDRERDTPVLLESDRLENLARVQALLPELATSMAQAFASGQVRDWAGVRCSVPDRLPMVGAVPHAPDGLWLCAALGSRGLTLSVLCGELLAAQWCGEPPPIEPALARALSSQRFIKP